MVQKPTKVVKKRKVVDENEEESQGLATIEASINLSCTTEKPKKMKMKATKLKAKKYRMKKNAPEKEENKEIEKEVIAEKAQTEVVVKEPTKKFKRLKKVTTTTPVVTNCELFADTTAIYQEARKNEKEGALKIIKEKNKKKRKMALLDEGENNETIVESNIKTPIVEQTEETAGKAIKLEPTSKMVRKAFEPEPQTQGKRLKKMVKKKSIKKKMVKKVKVFKEIKMSTVEGETEAKKSKVTKPNPLQLINKRIF